jgi:hypothetical protein
VKLGGWGVGGGLGLVAVGGGGELAGEVGWRGLEEVRVEARLFGGWAKRMSVGEKKGALEGVGEPSVDLGARGGQT